MKTTTTTHTPTPLYGYEEISPKWTEGIALGLRYAVRTLDPLTRKINEGSRTLTYCFTREAAETIVRAVNLFGPLVENLKDAHKFLADGSLLKNEIAAFIKENEL